MSTVSLSLRDANSSKDRKGICPVSGLGDMSCANFQVTAIAYNKPDHTGVPL